MNTATGRHRKVKNLIFSTYMYIMFINYILNDVAKNIFELTQQHATLITCISNADGNDLQR